MTAAAPFELRVCGAGTAKSLILGGWPDRAVSLLDPDFPFPEAGKHHLILRMHDLEGSKGRRAPPSGDQVRAAVRHALSTPTGGKLLIHCHMGLSRSPAMAAVAMCAAGLAPEQAVAAVAGQSPVMSPNARILALGDGLLGLDGALVRAASDWARSQNGAGGSSLLMPDGTLRRLR